MPNCSLMPLLTFVLKCISCHLILKISFDQLQFSSCRIGLETSSLSDLLQLNKTFLVSRNCKMSKPLRADHLYEQTFILWGILIMVWKVTKSSVLAKNLLPEEQCSFMPDCSTTLQLLRMNRWFFAVFVFLDICRAYDSTWYSWLLYTFMYNCL